MVRQHHRLNGPELEQTLGDSGGQGSLMCCNPWGHRVGHDLALEQQQSQAQWEVILPSGCHILENRSHKMDH